MLTGIQLAAQVISELSGAVSLNAMVLSSTRLLAVQGLTGANPPHDDLLAMVDDPDLLPQDHLDGYFRLGRRYVGDALVIASSGLPREDWIEQLPNTVMDINVISGEWQLHPLIEALPPEPIWPTPRRRSSLYEPVEQRPGRGPAIRLRGRPGPALRARHDTGRAPGRPDLIAAYPVAGLSTVAELANASGTSSATVVRLVQKLGFEGYPQFQSSFARSSPPALRDRPTGSTTATRAGPSRAPSAGWPPPRCARSAPSRTASPSRSSTRRSHCSPTRGARRS